MLLRSRDLAGGSVRPQRGSEICVGVFRPSIFNYYYFFLLLSAFVSNVPITFSFLPTRPHLSLLQGKRDAQIERETLTEELAVDGGGCVMGWERAGWGMGVL